MRSPSRHLRPPQVASLALALTVVLGVAGGPPGPAAAAGETAGETAGRTVVAIATGGEIGRAHV